VTTEETTMRYMLLIYTNPEADAGMTEADGQAMYGEYMKFTQGIVASGEFVAGDPLAGVDTATTVRVRGGKTATTDGPFAETKEVLAGYYLVEAADLDRAIALAAQIPSAKTGSVEVRPLGTM
jgi:hypothetical protein